MTDRRFTHFVIFAEMRTGSNFLEENINQFPDLACHGELFNPHFIGGPNRKDTFGMTLKQRTREPYKLIEAIRADDTTNSFSAPGDGGPSGYGCGRGAGERLSRSGHRNGEWLLP